MDIHPYPSHYDQHLANSSFPHYPHHIPGSMPSSSSSYSVPRIQDITYPPSPHSQSLVASTSAVLHEDYDRDVSLPPQPATQSSLEALMEDDGRAGGLSRPLTVQEQERLAHLDRLKFFLATAPSRWSTKQEDDPDNHHLNPSHPALNRFLLPNQEYVSCVLWNGLYHITGTDIVRALVFRFEAFGRPVKNMKKFEEGVFSDLRNLKPGMDACLEEPKARLLSFFLSFFSFFHFRPRPWAIPASAMHAILFANRALSILAHAGAS